MKIKKNLSRIYSLFRISIKDRTLRIPHADRIFSHTTIEERIILKKLALKSSGHALEIGSYLGSSSCYIADAMKKNNKKLYCIDTWKNHSMSEGEKDTYEEFVQNIYPYRNTIEIYRGFSSEISEKLDQQFGFVFFDGDHSYDGISTDWNSWKGKLSTKAYVCFHDYGWAEGVQKLVHENIRPIAITEGILPNLYWAMLTT